MAKHETTLDLSYRIEVTPETACRLMTDRDFVVEVREVAGDEEIEVACSGQFPKRRTECSSRMVGLTTLPKMVRKLFAKRSYVQLTLDWDRNEEDYVIEYRASIGDGVGAVAGHAVLRPDGTDGSLVTENFTASTNVPLVHRPLLAFIVKTARKMLAGDFEHAEAHVRKSTTSAPG